MVVDEYEQYHNDRADVVLVSPSGSASEPEPEPLADDCTVPTPFLNDAIAPCLRMEYPDGILQLYPELFVLLDGAGSALTLPDYATIKTTDCG